MQEAWEVATSSREEVGKKRWCAHLVLNDCGDEVSKRTRITVEQEILFNKGKKKVSNSKRCSHLTRIYVVFIETQQEIVYNTWRAVCSTSHIEQKN